MTTHFTRAIARRPGDSYLNGLTTSKEGPPNLAKAILQHNIYVQTLEDSGLSVTVLPAAEAFPDSVFVEDTAILTPEITVLTRPGAVSRRDETQSIKAALLDRFDTITEIVAPGTVDGGDICETDSKVLIGLSKRTNLEGALQLQSALQQVGRPAEIVDIRSVPGLLHLKTGISYLGEGRMAVMEALASLSWLADFDRVLVPASESYAANCIAVNGSVVVADGYPRFFEMLDRLGLKPVPLDVSEFRKMDGGLSCLSLRF